MTGLAIKFLTMNQNPAESFARWMCSRRSELGITLDVLQERTGIKKQHLSVLERASPHSLTGKAVIPKRPTVEKIAKGLQSPVNEAMEAAGYAPQNQRIPDIISSFDFSQLNESALKEIESFIKFKFSEIDVSKRETIPIMEGVGL